MRKYLVALSVISALFVGGVVGVAYASPVTTDLGAAVKFKLVNDTHVSSTSGSDLSYFAQCPNGYKAIGGGGYVFQSGNYNIVKASYPDDDKWRIIAAVSTGQTVSVRAICVNAG